MVCGFRFLASCAHAASGPMRTPAAATAVAGITVALPRRNMRRLTLVRLSTSLMFVISPCSLYYCRSAIAAVTLQDLDPVAVGVLQEEEFRHQAAVAMEFANRCRRQPFGRDAGMVRGKILHRECDVAVTVAQRIWFGQAVINRQLQFELAGIAQQI